MPRLPTGVSASAAHWSECLKTPRSTHATQMIESYRADAFYDAMRCKGHLLRRYHSLTCEPCKRVFKDSRVCKTSKIKRDPDALDNLVEHFRSRKHAKTVSANLIMIAARILVALDGLSLARPSVTYRPHHIPTPSRPICQEPASDAQGVEP